MTEYTSLILAILLLVCVVAIFKFNKALKEAQKPAATSITTDIEQIKSIGELSVFQVYSKEIVTKTDHAFGNFGKEYLRWLVSEKKLSMIFEFEINFIYDLTSPKLEITQIANSKFKVKMPPCKYKFSIANMKFYDEKNGKFIPFLLPDSLNGFLRAQVRLMVASLLKALNLKDGDELLNLAINHKKPLTRIPAAAQGLYLSRVFYR